MIYVEDSSQVYACTPSGWSSLKGEKGDKGDEGKAGKNGKNGENGKDGKEGSSCTATELDDKSGYKIVCGGNSVGVVLHGRDASSDVMIDGRDKKIYKIVKIGNQTWMAENLNYAPKSGSYCYKNNDANCAKYGRLYTWAAAMEACPTGWHLPSHSEWLELFKAVGGYAVAGQKLKTSNGWNGTDDYGFSVLPSGFWTYTGYFGNEGSEADLWSSTPTDVYAFVLRLNGENDVYMASLYRTNAYSVRCLKDK